MTAAPRGVLTLPALPLALLTLAAAPLALGAFAAAAAAELRWERAGGAAAAYLLCAAARVALGPAYAGAYVMGCDHGLTQWLAPQTRPQL